jgi:hypothetical protein
MERERSGRNSQMSIITFSMIFFGKGSEVEVTRILLSDVEIEMITKFSSMRTINPFFQNLKTSATWEQYTMREPTTLNQEK